MKFVVLTLFFCLAWIQNSVAIGVTKAVFVANTNAWTESVATNFNDQGYLFLENTTSTLYGIPTYSMTHILLEIQLPSQTSTSVQVVLTDMSSHFTGYFIVDRISTGWNENTVTWDSAPSFISAFASGLTSTKSNALAFNITSFSNSNLGQTVSFRIAAVPNSFYTTYYCNEDSTASLRPKLEIA